MDRRPARPRRSAASRPWRVASFASLDFETTGLDLQTDEVISFGVVPIDDGRVRPGHAAYRQCRPVVQPKPASIVVHRLRPADLAEAPPFEIVAPDLRQAIDGRFVLAWAAEIEAAFLARAFGRSPRWWRRRIVDVLRLAILIESSVGDARLDRSLTAVAERLRVPVEDPHHALDDALTTAQIFLVLMPELERRGIRTPRRLLRASRH